MSPVCLSANSETLVEVKCPPQFNDKTVLIESKPELQFKDFAMARSFNLVKNGKTCIKNMNYTPKMIKRREPVALIKPLGTVVSCAPFQEVNESEIDQNQQVMQSPEALKNL